MIEKIVQINSIGHLRNNFGSGDVSLHELTMAYSEKGQQTRRLVGEE